MVLSDGYGAVTYALDHVRLTVYYQLVAAVLEFFDRNTRCRLRGSSQQK
jgi:hypothetical protein